MNIFFRVLLKLLLELRPPSHARCCLCLVCVCESLNKWFRSVSHNGGLAAFAFSACLFDLGARAEGKEHDCLEFKKKILYLQKETRKVVGIEKAKRKREVWEHRRNRQKSLWFLQQFFQHQEWDLRSLLFYCQQRDMEQVSEALHTQRDTIPYLP